MRLWLLLVSLLVFGLSPLGDGDCVMDYYSWSLCRKLLSSGQMTPKGLEILLTQTGQHWICIKRNCISVAVQHKQRNVPLYHLYIVYSDHGYRLSHQALRGIIHSSHFPVMVVSVLHKEGKSNAIPAMHIIRDTSTKAGGEISHIAMDIFKNCPDSQSVWLVHHHSAASSHSFQAFLLEKSKIWAPAAISQQQKMLTKTYYAAAIVIISCCLKEITSAMDIKKISRQQIADPLMRQKESTQRVRDIKDLKQYDGQRTSTASALVNKHDILQAATLHCIMKTSDLSQLERNAASYMKKNEYLILDEESTLQKGPQKQLSLKAASRVDDNDGFYVKRQLLLVSREKKESIKRPQYKLRAAQDDNKNFYGKIITEQAELQRPEGESETEGSHINTIENGNQKRLANIAQSDFTKEGEEGLIILFLPDIQMGTQTEPSSARKPTLNTDTGWKTVNIPTKELGEPPPMAKVKPENSKCKCLKENKISLEMYTIDSTVSRDLKPAESTASAYTEEKVRETTGKTEHTQTNNIPHETMSINHTKQEEKIPSEESVIPSPPSHKITETEMTKTEHIAEATTVNMEIKETTSSMEVFSQDSTQKADVLPRTEETSTSIASPEPETDSKPRHIKCETRNIESCTGNLFTGLRMREDILADVFKGGVKNEEIATTNRPEPARKKEQNPGINSFTFSNPLEMIHKQATAATENFPKTTDVPLCRGLIHRTEAGWKHCMERFGGSKIPTHTFQDMREQEKEHTSIRDHHHLNDDEYDHFYYVDGVLKGVQSNFYPYYKRQMSQANTEKSIPAVGTKGDTHENLLSYIQRLALRNKISHYRRPAR